MFDKDIRLSYQPKCIIHYTCYGLIMLFVCFRGKTEFALNKFADISPAEFTSKILMPKREPPVFEESR